MAHIALTGHSRGFGFYMASQLKIDNSLTCFSRSNGYDITQKETQKKITELVSHCDIFINNAQQGFAQTELLYEVYYSWQNESKLILNIGSNARDFSNKNQPYDYAIQKMALNAASKQLGRIGKCRVVTVDFGFLNRAEGTSIGYEEAYEYIQFALSSFKKNHRLLEILVAHE